MWRTSDDKFQRVAREKFSRVADEKRSGHTRKTTHRLRSIHLVVLEAGDLDMRRDCDCILAATLNTLHE